ncbi:N/A [soil metagenome]
MLSICFISAAFALSQDVDVNQLPIGRAGTTVVASGRLTDLRNGSTVTAADVAKAARGKQFVFLGEQHATPPDQQFEADVIRELVRDGRQVVVGMEMYQRPKQNFLDQYSEGQIAEDDFLLRSDWKGQWGFDFAFYRPVFDQIRLNRIPLVGLNVPRDWVRSVGKGGYAALTPEQREQLPADLGFANSDHRMVFNGLMGGHPGMSDAMMDNVYAAQVLWDDGMADTFVRYIKDHNGSSKTVYVVIAGSGHVMYEQGINYRLRRHGLGVGPTVVMIQSNENVSVANGLGDFVLVSPKQKS